MFESLAKQLRGGVPDRLSSVLGSDLRDTRRAMEVSLPALIGGLRDRADEPGGPEAIMDLIEGPAGVPINDVDSYLTETDPRIGASALDQIFGSRGEPALTSLSKASGLSTKLLAQVMSMLGPVVTGWLGQKVAQDDMSPAQIRTYLGGEADRLDQAGYGKVLALVGGRSQVASPTSTPAPPPAEQSKGSDPIVVGNSDSRQRIVTVSDGGHDGSTHIPDTPDQISSDSIASSGSVPVMAGAAAGAAAGAHAHHDGSAAHPDAHSGGHDAPPPTSANPTYVAGGDSSGSDMDYGGERSSRSLLWWILAGIMLVVAGFFIFQQCTGGGSDPSATDTNTETSAGSADDTAIKQQVDAAIAGQYPNVTTTVTDGTVVLSGNVADLNEETQVQQVVAGVTGVQNVVADMQIGTGDNPVGKIEQSQELTQFAAMLNQFPEVKEQLEIGTANTIFVPSDAAFTEMTDTLTPLQADPASWEQVLKYHIVPGQGFSSSDLLAAGATVSTMQSEVLQFSSDADGKLVVNGIAQVILPDQPADYGSMLQVVDKVLVPPSLGGEIVEPPAEGGADGEGGEAAGDGDSLNAELDIGTVSFESGSSVLTDSGKTEVDKVVAYMNENPDSKVEIEGHTDSLGEEAANQTLSQQRADAVKAYMEEQGIAADRLTAVGLGETQLLEDPDDTEEKQAANRRIVFKLVG